MAGTLRREVRLEAEDYRLKEIGCSAMQINHAFLEKYHVDHVPAMLRLPYLCYGYGVGALLFLVILAIRGTVDVTIRGRENLAGHKNHIFCLWHGYVPLIGLCCAPSLSAVLDGAPQVWMQHPNWYMKPIHVLLRLLKVKEIILGSTGHAGRRAADQLVERLRQGCSTVINPDGPNGPPKILKKGILHMALKSGTPVVALRFSTSAPCELKSWDTKQLARPFASVEMEIGKPIRVTAANFDQAGRLIADALCR